MKKKSNIFKGLLVASVMFCFPFIVSALEVSDASELDSCLATNGNTCKLTTDINYGSISYKLIKDKEITIDLNGHELSGNATYGMFYVHQNGILTIKDSSDAKTGKLNNTSTGNGYGISMTKAAKVTIDGGTVYGKYAAIYNWDDPEQNQIIVNGGTLEGYWYAAAVFNNDVITVNDGVLKAHGSVILNNGGDTLESTINIKGGEIIQLDDDSPAIFHPGIGTLNISGGKIIGGTGIEMRSGTLNVTGGTIEATYTSLATKANGSGATVKGAGIAVSQHTTKNPIEINISKGTISGYVPFFEKNIQGNDQTDLDKITLNITGGKFIATNDGTDVVLVDDFTSFITGGTYNLDIDNDYILEPYAKVKDGDNYIVKLIAENNIEPINLEKQFDHVVIGISKNNLEKAEEIILGSIENDEDLLENIEGYEISIGIESSENTSLDEDVKALMETKLSKNAIVLGYYDINVVIYEKGTENVLGDVTELNSPITITLMLPKDIKKVKEGYTRTYYIVRNHDGNIDLLNAKISSDSKSISFKTDKFSSYSLAYVDKKDIENPNTSDGIMFYLIIGFISLASLGLLRKIKLS